MRLLKFEANSATLGKEQITDDVAISFVQNVFCFSDFDIVLYSLNAFGRVLF